MRSGNPVFNDDAGRIDAVFEELNQRHQPGVAVGIALNGRPVYCRGFGLANVAIPAVLTPSTRMRVQSATKHFTCLAYLLLCEQGLAHPDDPLRKYLPDLHRVTHDITIRQVMGHVSGLRDSHDIRYQFSGTGQEVDTDALVSLYRTIDDVNFQPGTGWCYCNGGYGILSVVIERITGTALEEVLRNRIFDPLGMSHTLLCRHDGDLPDDAAANHTRVADGSFRMPPAMGALAGNGGIVSTVNDMLRWLAHMDAPIVGSRESWELMKTPQVLTNGTRTGYGLGLIVGRYRGVATISHPGGTLGSTSQMLKIPAAGLDMEIMSNRDDVSCEALACRVLDACLSGLEPVEERDAGRCITGTFRSKHSGRVVELYARDGRQMAFLDGSPLMVEHRDRGELRVVSSSGVIRQSLQPIGETEEPNELRLDDFGNIDELQRVAPAVPEERREIAGAYASAASRAHVLIEESDGGLRLRAMGAFGSAEYALECIGERTWRARTDSGPFGGALAFSRDLSEFRFSTRATRGLPFARQS